MLHFHDDQTIIAQCTPRGSGAIALLRISGINAIEIIDRIGKLASGKKLIDLPSHTIHYGSIIKDTTIADNVLFLLMRGPKTFTGQDTIEITCHNNQFIIEEIIALAIHAGARLAQEGEFSKRAVLNGKIDLVQAEAINELIHAQTQIALKQSLSQMDGSFSYWLSALEKDLLKALALSEASFEFLDEEIEFAPQISTIIASVTDKITSIKKTFNQQQHIRQGIRVAIIGSVNAGKSSLFNALLNQNRAIVNAQAGTTRDSIEAGLFKNGNYWTLVDTAGLRQTNDTIEQEGIRRSLEEAHKADIIILAYDSAQINAPDLIAYNEIKEKYSNKIITVLTKADCKGSEDAFGPEHSRGVIKPEDMDTQRLDQTIKNPISVSSRSKQNIDTLESVVEQKIASLFASIESPFLLNKRQHNLLLALETKLTDITTMLAQKPVAYELLSIHLNDTIAHLAELSGKAISEAGMDMIFREFCIGK